MEYIVFTLILIIFICVYVIFNLYIKLTKYENIIAEFQTQQETDFLFINSIHHKMVELDSNLNNTELRSAFESDDEIGFYFKHVTECHKNIVTYVQEYNSLYIGDNVEEKE